jgi:hypothetical protein
MSDLRHQGIFDLTANPFVLFSLPLNASVEEIANSIEDARNQSEVPADVATSAKQVLLTPRLRIEAELECLVDTDFSTWRPVLVAARSSQRMSAILKAIHKLGPVSRANVIAHCAVRKGSDEESLINWKQAVDSIELETIQNLITKFREEASFVKPSIESLKDACDALIDKHSKALLNGFADGFSASLALAETIERMFKSSPKINNLSVLIDNYRRFTQAECSQLSKEVRDCIQKLPHLQDGGDPTQGLSNVIAAWGHYSRPIQLFEALQGRDDAEARSVYFEVRGAMLDQVEKGKIETAQAILQVCKAHFSGPRLAEQIASDENDLTSRGEFEKVEALANIVSEIKKELSGFAKQLERQRFGPTARSRVGDLFREFQRTARAAADSTAADLPWLLMRNLAIEINNDASNPEAAYRLLDGLLACAGDIVVSAEMTRRLGEDHATADKNRKELKLIEKLKAGDKPAALALVNQLLSGKAAVENVEQMKALKLQLEQANHVNWGAWIWIGVIVAGIIIMAAVNGNSPKQSIQSPSSSPAVSQQPNYTTNATDLSETPPPVGKGSVLTIQQLRYCLFEDYRLEYIRGRTTSPRQVQQFNFRISDFNSRCGDVRFRRNDRAVVDSQLLSQGTRLQMQSDNLLNSWR